MYWMIVHQCQVIVCNDFNKSYRKVLQSNINLYPYNRNINVGVLIFNPKKK